MQDYQENWQEPSHPDGWYGPFYFAPKDSRTIVPRRGPGSTVNFARPEAYLVVLTPVVVGTVIVLCVWLFK